jgi:hypothetical protein
MRRAVAFVGRMFRIGDAKSGEGPDPLALGDPAHPARAVPINQSKVIMQYIRCVPSTMKVVEKSVEI